MNGSEKDAEIIKLNMHIADEKRKANKKTRTIEKSISNQSLKKSVSPSRATGIRSKDIKHSKFNSSGSERNNEAIIAQLQEENEQFQLENKQLKKKSEGLKKQYLGEVLAVKTLKKEMKLLQEKLNTPEMGSDKNEIELKLEIRYMEKYEKYRQNL